MHSNDSFGNSDIHHQILATDGEVAIDVEEKLSELRSETQAFEDEGNPIVIDGYFGDWDNVNMMSDVTGDVPNSNIDLENYARQIYGKNTYYYASVSGDILNGIAIPSNEPRSVVTASSTESNHINLVKAFLKNLLLL